MTKVVAQFPQGEAAVAVTVWNDRLVVATTRGAYIANRDGDLERIGIVESDGLGAETEAYLGPGNDA